MNKFQVLYFFESEELSVFETKRLDLSTSASLSDVYKWTVFLKKDQVFESLKFKAMTRTGVQQGRKFVGAELEFDLAKAVFSYKKQQYDLSVESPESMPAALKLEAEKFLLSIPQHR